MKQLKIISAPVDVETCIIISALEGMRKLNMTPDPDGTNDAILEFAIDRLEANEQKIKALQAEIDEMNEEFDILMGCQP